MKKTCLVVAAHPDDEVLGCGGTIARFAREGYDVNVLFMTDGVSARHVLGNESSIRRQAAEVAADILGVKAIFFGQFPDNRMDSVPLLDIVKLVEDQIELYQPIIVFTHHAGDLNIDHRLTNQAVLTACRPQPGHSVKTLLFYEVASSTEWQTPASGLVFSPNWFVDISEFTELRFQALEAYCIEMRRWPHSRSISAIEHLMRYRGASVGVEAAEAFMLGRHILMGS